MKAPKSFSTPPPSKAAEAACSKSARTAEAPPSPSASAYFRACSSSASPPSAWRTCSTSRRTPPPWYARTTATSWWRTPSVRSSASCPAVSKADRPGSPAPGTSPCSSPSTTTATECSKATPSAASSRP